jgi:hypothetical protein
VMCECCGNERTYVGLRHISANLRNRYQWESSMLPQMRLSEDIRKLRSLFLIAWQQVARQSGAVRRLRGFQSPDVLLRVLVL